MRLNQIRTFFGVGTINVRKNRKAIYTVGGVKDLINEIIPHFFKYRAKRRLHRDFLLLFL